MDDYYYHYNIKHINFYTGSYENEISLEKLYFLVCVKKFDSVFMLFTKAVDVKEDDDSNEKEASLDLEAD